MTCETSLNKVRHMFLYPSLVILTMKISIHLLATWIHYKTGAMELPENLLSQIYQLGNHNPSPIPKAIISVNRPTFSPVIDCTQSLMDDISASCPWDLITLLSREGVCHAPDPSPTQMTDPNRSPERDTIYTIYCILYWDSH